jgi:hypothetical protein
MKADNNKRLDQQSKRITEVERELKELKRLVQLFQDEGFIKRLSSALDKVVGDGVDVFEKSTDDKIKELIQ